MKFLRFICLIIIFLPLTGNSQHILSGNFVPNPSFEEYDSCPPPCGTGSLEYCKDWFSEYGDGGSSDYYNTCSSGINCILMINVQLPRTGSAYAGINVFSSLLNNGREYIEIQLNNKLKNKKYCSEYFVSLPNACSYAIENINMFFSSNKILKDNINFLSLNPQIKNNKGIITDTANWVKIIGSFNANGDEEYITIGNFDSSIYTI